MERSGDSMDMETSVHPQPPAGPPAPRHPRRPDRRGAVRWTVGLVCAWALMLVVGARPFFYTDAQLRAIIEQRFSRELNLYYAEIVRERPQFAAPLLVDLNPFVRLRVQLIQNLPVSQNEDIDRVPGAADRIEADAQLRWNNLFIATLVVAIAIGLGWVLFKGVQQPFTTRAFSRLPSTRGTGDGAPGSPLSGDGIVDELFLGDIRNAQDRAEQLDRRATVLLVAGVTVAMMGTAILYMLLPAPAADARLADTLAKSVRPLGIGIFVEAIAWYLLRQHRVLMEESRTFFNVYLRRSNHLAAARLARVDARAAGNGTPPLIDALVKEPFADRLTEGERTVTSAIAEEEGRLPLHDVLAGLVERIPKPG